MRIRVRRGNPRQHDLWWPSTFGHHDSAKIYELKQVSACELFALVLSTVRGGGGRRDEKRKEQVPDGGKEGGGDSGTLSSVMSSIPHDLPRLAPHSRLGGRSHDFLKAL